MCLEYKEIVVEGPAAAILSAEAVEGWEMADSRAGGWMGAGRDKDGTWSDRAVTYVLRRERKVDGPNVVRQDARRAKR